MKDFLDKCRETREEQQKTVAIEENYNQSPLNRANTSQRGTVQTGQPTQRTVNSNKELIT
jgi:hypothetical protein